MAQVKARKAQIPRWELGLVLRLGNGADLGAWLAASLLMSQWQAATTTLDEHPRVLRQLPSCSPSYVAHGTWWGRDRTPSPMLAAADAGGSSDDQRGTLLKPASVVSQRVRLRIPCLGDTVAAPNSTEASVKAAYDRESAGNPFCCYPVSVQMRRVRTGASRSVPVRFSYIQQPCYGTRSQQQGLSDSFTLNAGFHPSAYGRGRRGGPVGTHVNGLPHSLTFFRQHRRLAHGLHPFRSFGLGPADTPQSRTASTDQ